MVVIHRQFRHTACFDDVIASLLMAACGVCTSEARMTVGLCVFVLQGHCMLSYSVLQGTIHTPVLVHLCTLRIILPQCVMVQLIFVNFTSHPALHNRTTDNRECGARPGMMCPWSAIVHVAVELTCAPSDNLTMRGLSAGCTLVAGVSRTKK